MRKGAGAGELLAVLRLVKLHGVLGLGTDLCSQPWQRLHENTAGPQGVVIFSQRSRSENHPGFLRVLDGWWEAPPLCEPGHYLTCVPVVIPFCCRVCCCFSVFEEWLYDFSFFLTVHIPWL